MKTEQLLHILGDERTLQIFQSIRVGDNREELSNGMTRKEFYSRLARLKRIGLVHKNGGYNLTTLGKLVAHKIVDMAQELCKNQWNLKAVDAMADIPREELDKLIAILIKDGDLQKVLR